MTVQIQYDTPAERFGETHIAREFSSPLTYDIDGLFDAHDSKIDRLVKSEAPSLATRGGRVAVMDTVTIANRKPVARLETLDS